MRARDILSMPAGVGLHIGAWPAYKHTLSGISFIPALIFHLVKRLS